MADNESVVSFIKNSIFLSAFKFAENALEDVCHFLSGVEKLDEVKDAKTSFEHLINLALASFV